MLVWLPQLASAHGDRFEDYSCFSLGDHKVRFCLPYEAALIEMDVTEGTVWTHYETEQLPVTYGVVIEAVENLVVPRDINAGYAMTQFANGMASVNPPPRARAMTVFDDMAIVEIEAGDATLNAFFVEVFTPKHIARFDVIDGSPEFPDMEVNWESTRSGLRYGIEIEGNPLGSLSPVKKMEVVPWP